MKTRVNGVRGRWGGGWRVAAGAWVAVAAAAGVEADTLELKSGLGTTFGVMTNQKWWAGFGNAGLLQIGLGPTYTWENPQYGYGDAGFNWAEGPAVFVSNGTEQFAHAWSAGDVVIQNTGVVKILSDSPDYNYLTLDLTLRRATPEASASTGGWLTIQQHYYGAELLSGPIEFDGSVFRLTGFPINAQGCVITISGGAGVPYLGVDLVFHRTALGGGPAVPEPTEIGAVVAGALAGWGIWRARRGRRRG